MFESVTRKERTGAAELVLVIAIAAVGLGVQGAILVGAVGEPIASAWKELRRPTFEEEIVIVGPSRAERAAAVSWQGVPWRQQAHADSEARSLAVHALLCPPEL